MYISRNKEDITINLWRHKPVKYEANQVSRWVGWKADSYAGQLNQEDVSFLDLTNWDGNPIEVEIVPKTQQFVGETSEEQPKQRFMIDVSTDVEDTDIINRCIDAVSDVLAESGKYFGVGCPMK